jgi:hypothetical protein
VHGPFRGGSNDQCAIVQCPPGPAGAAGPPGPAGPPGLAGLQGLKGESGEFNYANDGTPLPLQSDQGYASDEGVATHKVTIMAVFHGAFTGGPKIGTRILSLLCKRTIPGWLSGCPPLATRRI